MYPALEVNAGNVLVEDLPDTLRVTRTDGELVDALFTKQFQTIQTLNFGLAESYYTGPSSDGISWYIILEDFGNNQEYVWTSVGLADFDGEDIYPPFRNPCLIYIDEDLQGVKDQFADTYTVTGPPGGPVTVTRQSLCVWTGPDTCGNEVRLEFTSDADDYPYWFIGWLEYFGPVGDCNVLDSSSGVKDPYAQGGDGIDTPVGSYGPSYSVS